MIEELWTSLKAWLLKDGGHERLIEFLEHALTVAELERDKAEERDGSYIQ